MAATFYEDKSAFANKTITVTTSAELDSAIKSLSRGDGGTILVDGSADPYILTAQNVGRSGAPVLIKPLDEDVRPHIEQINILQSSHLTITGMDIDSSRIASTRPAWESDVNVRLSNDITLVGNNMDSTADGYRESYQSDVGVGARGAMLRDSENIIFSHNKVSDYRDGIIYLEVKGLTLVGNEITGIQGDGMRGGGIQDVLIAENYMHDFYGSVQTVNHSDMIQIWGNNVDLVTRNVVIRDNILDAGNGAATQSILILNEHFNRTGYYDNIKIHDNVIHNALQQGIGVDHVKELEVYNNTVLWNANATTQARVGSELVSIYPRMIIRDSPDARVEDNITGPSIVNEVLLSGEDNILLSFTNPLADNYAGKHFVNLSGEGDLDLRDIAYMPDSPFNGVIGARLTSDPLHETGALALDQGDDATFAVIRGTHLPGARDGIHLSAELTTLAQGQVTDENVTLRWTFSDGTVREGLVVKHVFLNGDNGYDVTLDVYQDGTLVDTLTRKASVDVEDLLDLDFNNNAADTTSFASRIDLQDRHNDAFVEARDGNTGFELDGGTRIDVDRTNTQITKLDTFNMEIGFKKDGPGTSGNLVLLHKVFSLHVETDGVLTFRMETSDGYAKVVSSKGAISDNNWHDINVVYDGPAGSLSLQVDGQTVGTSTATGATKAGSGFDMVIGSLFSESVHGIVDKFSLTTPTSSIYDDLTDDIASGPVAAPVPEIAEIVEVVEVIVEEPIIETVEEVLPEQVVQAFEAPVEPTPVVEVVEEDTAPTLNLSAPAPVAVVIETPAPAVVSNAPEVVAPKSPAVATAQEQAEDVSQLLQLLGRFAYLLENARVDVPKPATTVKDDILVVDEVARVTKASKADETDTPDVSAFDAMFDLFSTDDFFSL